MLLINILSVDHGANCGWCYIKDGVYCKSGTFHLTGDNHNIRLTQLYDKLIELLFLYKIDTLAVEKVNLFGTKFGGDNVVKLAQYQGILRLRATLSGIHICEVNPMSMKKDIAGNGKAEKIDVARAVLDFCGKTLDEICQPTYITRGPNKGKIKSYIAEESDAIALAYYTLMKGGI